MIHSHDGSLYSSPYGRTDEHYILSISRLGLNQMLLTAAEKRENVNLHFKKRINKVDLDGRLEFADGTDAEGQGSTNRVWTGSVQIIFFDENR